MAMYPERKRGDVWKAALLREGGHGAKEEGG